MVMKRIVLFFILFLSLIMSLTSKSQDVYVVDSLHYLAPIKKELIAVWPHNQTFNLVFHEHSMVAGYQGNHEMHTFESYPYLLLKKLKKNILMQKSM